MDKQKKKNKKQDINKLAYNIVQQTIQENSTEENSSDLLPTQKNPAAVALGRLGGLKGGPARAKKLSPKERSEIARKAAKIRWENTKK